MTPGEILDLLRRDVREFESDLGKPQAIAMRGRLDELDRLISANTPSTETTIAAIRWARDTRYWTNAQWKAHAGEHWPKAVADSVRASDEAVDALLAERDALRETIERIEDNAEAWHGDNEAKARALTVIAQTCRAALEYRP